MTFPWNQFSHSEERKRIFRDAQFFSLCNPVYLYRCDFLYVYANSGNIIRFATQGKFLCGGVILLIDGDLGIGIAGQKSLGGLVDHPVFQRASLIKMEAMGGIEHWCRVGCIGSQTSQCTCHRSMTVNSGKHLCLHQML